MNYCTYQYEEVESFLKGRKEVILFGAGYDGFLIQNFLKGKGISVIAFCDNKSSLWKTELNGIRIISLQDLTGQMGMKYPVIITTTKYAASIHSQLITAGYEEADIFSPEYNSIIVFNETQYFDLKSWVPEEKEIFVDAGAYDGATTIAFKKWSGSSYQKSYLFEPNEKTVDICKNKLTENGIVNTTVIAAGTWSKKDTLYFKKAEAGSKIDAKGEDKIEVMDIDSVVQGDKVTFIKMDVEGSELESLKGAKDTILKYHPKLAICIYHKPEDVLTLPSYILELVPEYKFWIRHYSTNAWETVLYASV